MSDHTSSEIETVLAERDAFELEPEPEPRPEPERGTATGTVASLSTTVFETTIAVEVADGPGVDVSVSVTVPTLDAAVADDDVGSSLEAGWLETLERRLADAPSATRASVELDAFEVTEHDDRVVVRYAFHQGSVERGLDVAKTVAEYVEGTYVQGVVPGFEYEPPVSTLLAEAGQSEDGPGGTPL